MVVRTFVGLGWLVGLGVFARSSSGLIYHTSM